MIVLTVARGTAIECFRDRLLYLPIVFLLFILWGSLFFGALSLGEMERLVVDFGLAGITFFSLLVAVFLGVGWSYQGVSRRTAYGLLARPVSRRSVLWGAYLGLGCMQLAMLALMAVSWRIILALVDVPWSGLLTLSLCFIAAEALLVTALAFFLSTVASPAMAGATTVVLILAGYSSQSLQELARHFPGQALRGAVDAFYYLIPCLGNFSPLPGELPGGPGMAAQVFWVLAYGVSYTVALLTLAAAVFSRKELS